MPLLLRQLTNVIYELEGLAKVGKLESLPDVVFFDDVPTVHLSLEGGELLTLESGHASAARNACFGRKVGHRGSYSTTRREARSPPPSFGMRRELGPRETELIRPDEES